MCSELCLCLVWTSGPALTCPVDTLNWDLLQAHFPYPISSFLGPDSYFTLSCICLPAKGCVFLILEFPSSGIESWSPFHLAFNFDSPAPGSLGRVGSWLVCAETCRQAELLTTRPESRVSPLFLATPTLPSPSHTITIRKFNSRVAISFNLAVFIWRLLLQWRLIFINRLLCMYFF